MSANEHDYLWDAAGTPDPDVERLERVLGRLRSAPPPLVLPDPSMRHRWQAIVPLLATAATVALMVAVMSRMIDRSTPSWPVARTAGAPRIDASTLAASGRLSVGQTLTTDAASRARIEVGAIGRVSVEGNTTLRLVSTAKAQHRLALDRGTINAFIQAPPGQFVVDTPSATATDLGCVYTLHVDDAGGGVLSVVAGWVAFELKGLESFVPAGASCRTDPRRGPGTPRFDDADADWQAALDVVDFANDAAARRAALVQVLARARERDSVTLWHLLGRVDGAERRDVFTALSARVPLPDGVSADAVLRLDHDALDRWWNALGLGDTTLWRQWKRPYPAR
jgi:FecR protein